MDEGLDPEPTISHATRDNYILCIESINGFFYDKIIKDIKEGKWSICITVVKKGRAIFEDQRSMNNCIKCFNTITQAEIEENKENIIDKNILIFDDSIKTGGTIKGILKKVWPLRPKSVTIAAIIAVRETMDELAEESKFKNLPLTKFRVLHEIDGSKRNENFTSNYRNYHNKYIDAYLGYTCLPLQREGDYPYIEISLNSDYENELISIFNDHNLTDLETYSDRFKKTFVLDEKLKIKINSLISGTCLKDAVDIGLDPDPESCAYVRVFYRSDLKKLVLQPIIESLKDSAFQDKNICNRDYLARMCIIFFILETFIAKYMDQIDIKNINICLRD